MAGDRDHPWGDRVVAWAQGVILAVALALALWAKLFGDTPASNEIGDIPAMPWRSHPPLEVYR